MIVVVMSGAMENLKLASKSLISLPRLTSSICHQDVKCRPARGTGWCLACVVRQEQSSLTMGLASRGLCPHQTRLTLSIFAPNLCSSISTNRPECITH